ncbi:L-alanine-DL-glutamate epimerase [Kosmotoga arenicorallina S304]|uniref:Dipeptide epimerase n=1 Tax=Kosmotoga arenicorallina S304 TaxID=1453497 RepID=A0A176JTJ0_9BACT|nr:L-Ala-D/L-Glu epimerase [Kosmotoga arenicorallina]OAA26580.1 L-alanine-DL-glutamate epimerase [Kosmotoga arenicorallina S304]
MGKIKDIKFIMKEYQYEKPFHIANSISAGSQNLEIQLLLENGVIGYGEAAPSYRVNGERVETFPSLESFVKEQLIGLDVRNYRRIFDIMDKLKCASSVKAAVQFAVLDAFAEEVGAQVHQILGGAKDEIETDKTVGIDTVENMAKEAQQLFELGFRAIKIKVGEDLKKDIQVMEAIYEVSKGAKYVVDANTGYTPKEAITFAKEIYTRGIDIDVYEQPVQMENIEGLKLVRYNSPFPVAADESARTRYDVLRLIKEDAVDFVNIKLMKSGISDALAIVEMANTAKIQLMIGCMSESSVGINQSVQFALGTGAFVFHDLDSHLMLIEDEFRGKFLQDGPKIRAK